MGNWFVLVASRKEIIAEVVSAFRILYGQPVFKPEDDACVFYRVDGTDEGRPTVTLYFSPAAADLAERFGAQKCDNPSKSGLTLLIGDRVCEALTHAGAARSSAGTMRTPPGPPATLAPE